MDVYFSFQAALCFSVAHILIKRGLVDSNAMTGSFISLSMSAVTLWALVPFVASFSGLWNPALLIFIAAGILAPGVARSVPIANSSPIFASIFAVMFLAEVWVLQNMVGTLLVISGVVILSLARPATGEWRKLDILYPFVGAMAFGASAILRKAGLDFVDSPVLAAAVTAGAAAIFSFALLQVRGGKEAFRLTRRSAGWLFTAGFINTAAMLSVFYALSHGKVVIVEPLISSNPVLTLLLTAIFLRDVEVLTARIITGGLLTVVGTVLVVTAR